VKLIINNPTLKLFVSLKKKLLFCSDEWFQSFIDVEGITRYPTTFISCSVWFVSNLVCMSFIDKILILKYIWF